MTTYIALLKGINVGGHRPVAMADLRQLCSRLGFDDVRTILQSGNLVFRSESREPAALERMLETGAAAQLGLKTDFFVRTATHWGAVVAGNRFREEAKRDPARLHVMCLKDPPEASRVAALRAAITGPETIRAGTRELYVVYPNGAGRSRLTNALIEKTLGTRATGRNWNTVLKLQDVAWGQA